jgi:acetyl esterase/lipase
MYVLSYQSAQTLRLNIELPGNPSPAANCVLWWHGGAWREGVVRGVPRGESQLLANHMFTLLAWLLN